MPTLELKAQSLTKDLSAALEKLADNVTPKRVHKLRTTIRRMEGLISFAQARLAGKTRNVVEELEELRRRAGKVRDTDIQIDLLSKLANGSSTADRRVLAENLKRKRTRQNARLRKQAKLFLHSGSLDRLIRTISRVSKKREVPSDVLENFKSDLKELATHYSSQKIIKRKRLHEGRIKLKLLRYAAELGERSPAQEQFIAELKAVQDAIGDWHDWELLAKTAEKEFGTRVNCALLVEIRSLFTARHAAASGAMANLLARYAPAGPKKAPRSATAARPAAKRA